MDYTIFKPLNKFTKMKKENYSCSLTANTTASQATKGISNVCGWWAKNFEGSAQKAGDIFTVRFGETFVTFTVAELIPGKKIVWHVKDCFLHWQNDKTEWTGTDVVFDIAEKNNATQINFTHIGLVPEVECYQTCIKGWHQYVKESLPKLLMEHKGLPS